MALTNPSGPTGGMSLGEPHSDLTKKLIKEGCEPKAAPQLGEHWQATAIWRRGIMHAVERLDVVTASKLAPRAKLEAVQRALGELTELQRQHQPKSYEEAFEVCRQDHAKQDRAA